MNPSLLIDKGSCTGIFNNYLFLICLHFSLLPLLLLCYQINVVKAVDCNFFFFAKLFLFSVVLVFFRLRNLDLPQPISSNISIFGCCLETIFALWNRSPPSISIQQKVPLKKNWTRTVTLLHTICFTRNCKHYINSETYIILKKKLFLLFPQRRG